MWSAVMLLDCCRRCRGAENADCGEWKWFDVYDVSSVEHDVSLS